MAVATKNSCKLTVRSKYSVDDQSPQLMARFSDGELIKRYPCAQPSWTEIFLQH